MLLPAEMEYIKYWDMMTDQLDYSVRSQGIEDCFILLNAYFLNKILPCSHMGSY